MTRKKRFGWLPAVVAIPFLTLAALVVVATIVQAVRQESWGPILSIGWLPAVVVASLWAPTPATPCWPRLRGLAKR